MNYLILDIATAGIPNAADFVTLDDIEAPENYKKPEAIAAYCQAERQKRIAKAALDVDLARIVAFGLHYTDSPNYVVRLAKDEAEEAKILADIADYGHRDVFVTFNGGRFDLPLLMRRALYLGVKFPEINLDRYRTPHIDVWDRLSHHGVLKVHSLTWYVKRFGWTDLVKPLSGAEEATAAAEGRWDELAASVEHDLKACERIAQKMGLL